MVDEFRDAISGYAAAHPNLALHLIAVDVIDLLAILDSFEAGNQTESSAMVYRLHSGARATIPEKVLRFIFRHSSS